MGLVQSANDWTVGIHKQTNEATVGTIADYDFPVFSGRPQPVQTLDRVNVTDASAIVGDPYKHPDEHWEADIVVPAFSDSLGTFLVGLWPTDTATGTSPSKIHTFSGLGSGSTAWMSMYSKQGFAGNLSETFEAGQCSGITFSADENGGPLRIGYRCVGKKPTVASFTTTVPNTMAQGWLQAGGAVLKYEADNATPVTATNIQNLTVVVDRNVTPQATADSVSVGLISLGKVEPTFTMTLLWLEWEMYRATYYGAVAGTTASSTIVKGSVEFNFVHTVTGTHAFKLTIPSAVFAADPPQPNPDGGPLTVTINGYATKPGSGDHVQPVLTNSVTPAY